MPISQTFWNPNLNYGIEWNEEQIVTVPQESAFIFSQIVIYDM